LIISNSYVDAPALGIVQFNDQARSMHIEGGVGIFISASLNENIMIAPRGTLFGGLGIGGYATAPLNLISGSTYQGMRSDLVTRTAVNGYQMLTGSNNTMHIAPGLGSDITVKFPTTPTFGTTFTLVVDSPGTVSIETGSRQSAQDPIYKIQSPSSTTFAGAVYANSFSPAPVGVYNYMYLNVSSGSIGNAWVLTSKM